VSSSVSFSLKKEKKRKRLLFGDDDAKKALIFWFEGTCEREGKNLFFRRPKG
jgi:hypothetical protein